MSLFPSSAGLQRPLNNLLARSAKGDLTSSVLIRALHIVAHYLEARIIVQHAPRLSSLASIMADNPTRVSTSKMEAWATGAGAK